MNKVILIGNVGKDPEVKSLAEGKKVGNFTLATSDGWGDNQKTNWHNIVVWNKTAEVVEKFVKKGTKLAVEGRLDHRTYEDKDGNKRYVSEIVASSVEFVMPKSETPKEKEAISVDSDELPF